MGIQLIDFLDPWPKVCQVGRGGKFSDCTGFPFICCKDRLWEDGVSRPRLGSNHKTEVESGCPHELKWHGYLPKSRAAGSIPRTGSISGPSGIKVKVGEGGCDEGYLDSIGVKG